MTAAQEIEPNEQIFISYGRKKGDHELLSTYGFCLPAFENKNTKILISPGKFMKSGFRVALKVDGPNKYFGPFLPNHSVELIKINGQNQTKSWLMPGADNLVKYFFSLATGPSDDLIHAIKEIAANNFESFEVTWRDVLNYKLDRISNCPENFTEKLEFLTRNEIALINYFLENPPVQNFVESKKIFNSISEPLQ